MKKRVSLLLKIVLSTLTVLLYVANLIDAVFYISPYPRKTSLTSMLLSVAFLASYLLLLFVLRRKKIFYTVRSLFPVFRSFVRFLSYMLSFSMWIVPRSLLLLFFLRCFIFRFMDYRFSSPIERRSS